MIYSKSIELKITSPFRAIEAFPTSLSLVTLAGLRDHLTEDVITELREVEGRLQNSVSIEPILRARTDKGFERAFTKAYKKAMVYYVNSGITIWRAVQYDYQKLLELSQLSSDLVEDLFFEHAKRLHRDTFQKSVAGLRILRHIGARTVLAEESAPPDKQEPPITYLNQAVTATFVFWCILCFLQGEVKGVRRANLKLLAEFVFSLASEAYSDAVKRNLLKSQSEADFWNPSWQEGEVAADLDKRTRRVRSFSSLDDLLRDLHKVPSHEVSTN